MAGPSPLFGSGTARGGTGLVVQTLRAHPRIELAMEPFLMVFKHYRLAVHEKVSFGGPHRVPALSEPIRSLYFDAEDLTYWPHVVDAPVDAPILPVQLESLREGIRGRAAYDAADLVPFAQEVEGRTFAELLKSSLGMIQRARGRADLGWCGFLENWCVEFFPFLAQTFPTSKFFLVIRDPRAVLASALFAPPELRSTLLSYLRSIRKMFDMALHFSGDPRFQGRMCLLKYEALVANPDRLAAELCTFLGEDYDPRMIDPAYHVVPGSSELRDGVSSFETRATGYDIKRASRWKSVLEPEIVDVINACMAPELELFGYTQPGEASPLTSSVIARALAATRLEEIVPKWSTDMSSLAADYGAELLRAQWASMPAAAGVLNDRVLHECFLSARVADIVRASARGEDVLPAWRTFDHLIEL
ncbi:MAG: sulfotransferase [Vicinamibacterales bacterium]